MHTQTHMHGDFILKKNGLNPSTHSRSHTEIHKHTLRLFKTKLNRFTHTHKHGTLIEKLSLLEITVRVLGLLGNDDSQLCARVCMCVRVHMCQTVMAVIMIGSMRRTEEERVNVILWMRLSLILSQLNPTDPLWIHHWRSQWWKRLELAFCFLFTTAFTVILHWNPCN